MVAKIVFVKNHECQIVAGASAVNGDERHRLDLEPTKFVIIRPILISSNHQNLVSKFL